MIASVDAIARARAIRVAYAREVHQSGDGSLIDFIVRVRSELPAAYPAAGVGTAFMVAMNAMADELERIDLEGAA